MFSEGDFVAAKVLNQKFMLKIAGNAFFETVNNNEFKLSKFRGVCHFPKNEVIQVAWCFCYFSKNEHNSLESRMGGLQLH